MAGGAAHVILEVALEDDADLIVMGSPGLSDLAGLVLGSVNDEVIHLAHCRSSSSDELTERGGSLL